MTTIAPAPPGMPEWALPDLIDRSNPPDPLGGGVPTLMRPGSSAAWLQYDRFLQYWTGGGTITLAMMKAAQADGYSGIFLDPAFVWDMSGLVINGLSGFIVESRMAGSIGWLANVSIGVGFIKTDTGAPADGVQVFASSPAVSPTQGVVFRNCTFKGAHTGYTIHYGGGQRQCGLVDCLVQNTSSAVGAYAVGIDSALSDNNSENGIFSFTGGGGMSGAYGALGLGLGDQTQHANDTLFMGLVTTGGTYSINAANSANQTFVNWYDRSSPATANVLNSAGILTFVGGEHLNNTGLAHSITGGTTVLQNVLVSAGGATLTAGSLVCLGRCRIIGTVALGAGSGTVGLADPSGSYGSTVITGTAGTLMKAGFYSPGSAPSVVGFSGTTKTSTWA